jgi:methyl-accepting chemotaxis protein
MFKQMRKSTKEDILNCGACGYKSCEQMAVAIINNLNRPENCSHYVELEKQMQNEEESKRLLNQAVDSALTEMDKSIKGISSLSEDINETVSYVLYSSKAIEGMVKNVRNIHQSVEHNSETVIKLNTISLSGKNIITKISELIADVSKQSDVLIEACTVIGSIADETGILGMNAAIEAAHAGEAVGKGFAVVASEIRKLANNSSKQAVQITQSLKDIKELIDISTDSSRQAQEQFDLIVNLAGEVKNESDSISSAVEIQDSDGNQVLKSLEEINGLITKVKDESSGLLAANSTIVEQINSLRA